MTTNTPARAAINPRSIAAKAAEEFSLSLLDDRLRWPPEENVTAEDVKRACFDVALENATSAVERSLGKLVEPLTTDIDAEFEAEGALADFQSVVDRWIEGVIVEPRLPVIYSAAKEWKEKCDVVVNYVLGPSAFDAAKSVPAITVAQILNYANKDPRLDREGLRKSIAALVYPGASDVMKEDFPEIPAVLDRRGTKPDPAPNPPPGAWDDEPEADTIVSWDDEGELEPAAEPAAEPADVSWDDEPTTAAPASTASKSEAMRVCAMANVAGLSDVDMGAVIGMSKTYYSLIRNGKRPWPGLKPDAIAKLHKELDARIEAIAELRAVLADPEIAKPQKD